LVGGVIILLSFVKLEQSATLDVISSGDLELRAMKPTNSDGAPLWRRLVIIVVKLLLLM
jgi:hypothetical protein